MDLTARSAATDSVLLVGFGGPTQPDEILPFLENVVRGRPIPRHRLLEVAHHYELMGGRSPLTELTFRQARRLESALALDGPDLPVFVGMRNWHPFLAETLEEMQRRGLQRAVGLILSAHDSEAGWQRYVQDVAAARSELAARGIPAPEIDFAPNWHEHPGFIEAVACRVAQALALVPEERRQAATLLFTAHSIPETMARSSAYVAQYTRSCELAAARSGHARWMRAYQSRSGRPDDPWLEPDVNRALEQLAADGAQDVVVAPIGFVCDHVEVLYDLDLEAAATARRVGIAMHRAGTPGDHAAFVAMLGDLVRRTCASS